MEWSPRQELLLQEAIALLDYGLRLLQVQPGSTEAAQRGRRAIALSQFKDARSKMLELQVPFEPPYTTPSPTSEPSATNEGP